LLANLALVLVSTLATLVALEFALRFAERRSRAVVPVESGDLTPEYVPSDSLGWTLRPGAVQRFRRGGFDTTVRSNRLGFRGPEIEPKPAGVERWEVLGDSYAFGWGVEEDETYAAELARILNLARPGSAVRHEVVNAALPGFGTYQRLAALERLAPLGLDGIVVEFSASNDVVDDWRAAPYVPDRLGEYQARGTKFTAPERFLAAHSRLFRLGWDRAMPLRLWLEARRGKNLERSERWWEDLLARAAARGLRVVVVVNASRYQVLGEGGGVMSWLAHSRYGLRPNAMIRAVVERHQVPWVDGEEVFRGAAPAALFLGRDVHWTPEGHRLVARAVLAVIARAAADST
jgi:hypothetical protein